jgi:hypothetical protein
MSYVPNTCGVSTISVLMLALLFIPPMSFRRWWRCGVPRWTVLLVGVPATRLPVVCCTLSWEFVFSLNVIRQYNLVIMYSDHDIGFYLNCCNFGCMCGNLILGTHTMSIRFWPENWVWHFLRYFYTKALDFFCNFLDLIFSITKIIL